MSEVLFLFKLFPDILPTTIYTTTVVDYFTMNYTSYFTFHMAIDVY